jgi:hypothetical protein
LPFAELYMKIIIALAFIYVLSMPTIGQDHDPLRTLDSLFYSSILDSLQRVFDHNKTVPEEHKTVIYTALSFFPELDSTKIVFKEKSIRTTMNVRPTISSMIFRSRENRKYVIRMNNAKRPGRPLFEDAPFNARVGILGHEFAHIIDYKNQGFFGMGRRAISYLFRKSKARYENEIDAYTVERGIGWQLYDWKNYVIQDSEASKKYLRFKKRIYMMPDDIMQLIY